MTKGIDMLVKVNDRIVALQKGATLNRSVETIDRTTKQSGGWKVFTSSFKEWSIECDGLYTIPASISGIDADPTNPFSDPYAALEGAFHSGQRVYIEFVFRDDPINAPPYIPGTPYPYIRSGWWGWAIITDFPLEAPQDDSLTFSVTFQGTGPLYEKFYMPPEMDGGGIPPESPPPEEPEEPVGP